MLRGKCGICAPSWWKAFGKKCRYCGRRMFPPFQLLWGGKDENGYFIVHADCIDRKARLAETVGVLKKLEEIHVLSMEKYIEKRRLES